MKLNFFKYKNLIPLILSVILLSCVDDFPYRNVDIPEGDGILSATVSYTPLTERNLGTTRTDGDAIQNIESLCVLVYTPASEEEGKGKLVKKYSSMNDSEDKLQNYVPSEYKKDENNPAKEGTSAKASFELHDLQYGEYYIFAVANMGNLSKYENEIQTIEGLQNIALEWDPSDISKNNQMFGYFTPDNDVESTGFMPEQTIQFTGKASDSKIHAWLKRAASKVTVAYDPSGLNQGVTIYIRSVTLRDIPKKCLLGAENTPGEGDDFWNHLASYDDPDYKTPSEVDAANSRLEYNSKGVITDDNTHTGNLSTDGLKLERSDRSAIPEGAHNFDAPSLFFYENNQNPYLEKQPDFKQGDKKNDKYNKQPQMDGDDKVGTPIHSPENDSDFKDRVPYGTYIEVDAYYISSNPANPGEGSIKYRFMLGKDTDFDYDAERNYHYQVTLGFNGWANNPDWHIDYVNTPPAIDVPPVFRVSYLYQQKSHLPIKIVGDIVWLTVTITENNWAPYDPDPTTNQIITQGGKEYKVPRQTIATTPSAYQFQWNYRAFNNEENNNASNPYLNPTPTPNSDYPYNLPAGQQRPQFGFLALHLPSRDLTTIPSSQIAGGNGYGSSYNDLLINYWAAHQEGVRRFGKESNKGGNDFDIGYHTMSHNDIGENLDDNGYTVKPVLNDYNQEIDDQRILMLPVWTRTKSLIGIAGFSGNNPYEAFERKATLHIAAVFKDGERIEKDVEVFQVKRITNPKGVWRAHDHNETFNVTLLEAKNSNGESDFEAFSSQGEWTAYIDEQTNDGGFSIFPNGQTNGYMGTDEEGRKVIHGNSGSPIHFAIDFGAKVAKTESKCAIIKVLYHGNQCLHKILVRKGYNKPLPMGSENNKKFWSSFSLYQATRRAGDGGTEDGREVFDAVLTKNPLILGSMFRRGMQNRGIFVWNNMQTNLATFLPPNGATFVVGQDMNSTLPNDKDNFVSKWRSMTWNDIDFRNDNPNADPAGDGDNNLGIYYAEDYNGEERRYRVPTFEEFQDLTDNSEFGFGIFYGSSATAPQTESVNEYGLIDPYNEGLFDNPYGMRAVVAYDKKTGNQILFPIGKYGIGVRRMFNVPNNTYNGVLHYSDVYRVLDNANDLYRPIPYNLPIASGCIYWIDQYVAPNTYSNREPSLGWDMNYFNFDFNAYTANNYRDACPIKFVIDEKND